MVQYNVLTSLSLGIRFTTAVALVSLPRLVCIGIGISPSAQGVDESTPLLAATGDARGKASTRKTYGNIFVSIVGSGVLGLPFTYKTSGYAVSTICIVGSAFFSWLCMMKLVKCREELQKQGCQFVTMYGEIAEVALGSWGRQLADFMILIAQCGCCVAYLIFIGQNASSIFVGNISKYNYFIAILVPALVLMAWIRSLAGLAPFSIVADVCNVLAMAVVVKDDVNDFSDFSKVRAFQGWSSVPFAIGVALYCYEGFAMTLSLQSSMKKPKEFGRALAGTFVVITALYVFFGFVGYVAYGESTKEIITLNLPNDWTTVAIKSALSIALFFTFSVMLYPVHEIVEGKLLAAGFGQETQPVMEKLMVNILRGLIVLAVATVAATVPGFAVFTSLVGSTVCSMVAFVLPAVLHIRICRASSNFVSVFIDGFLIVFGFLFAVYGTYNALHDIFGSVAEPPASFPGS